MTQIIFHLHFFLCVTAVCESTISFMYEHIIYVWTSTKIMIALSRFPADTESMLYSIQHGAKLCLRPPPPHTLQRHPTGLVIYWWWRIHVCSQYVCTTALTLYECSFILHLRRVHTYIHCIICIYVCYILYAQNKIHIQQKARADRYIEHRWHVQNVCTRCICWCTYAFIKCLWIEIIACFVLLVSCIFDATHRTFILFVTCSMFDNRAGTIMTMQTFQVVRMPLIVF